MWHRLGSARAVSADFVSQVSRERGNACLTCDKFATDASYQGEHREQLAKLTVLIDQRKVAFKAKTGHEMSDDNVWLSQRLTEQR